MFDIDFLAIHNYIMNWLLISSLYTISVICHVYGYIHIRTSTFYNRYLKPCYFTHRGIQIITTNPRVRPSFEVICKSPKFIKWLNKFPLDQFDLVSIDITDVDWFSKKPNPEKLGFLKFTCEVYSKNGDPVDGIVFLRGDSVGILIIPEDENGKQYVLLTEQPRIPTCGMKEEIVAGMVDATTGQTIINDVLTKEILEETGLILDTNDPTYQQIGCYTLSGGGCDENIYLAVWRPTIDSKMITDMRIRTYGEEGSNEKIRLKIYDFLTFNNELERIGDAKTSLAWHRRTIGSLNSTNSLSNKVNTPT